MLLSKTIIHGVYVLCYLSRQPSDVVIPAGPIAESMSVPPEQAAKILQALTRAGLVRSTRGRRGGYALAKRPELLLADEPTGALDLKTSRHVLAILQRLNREQNLTIILITHNGAIPAIARRKVRIVSGRIAESRVNERILPAEEVTW